MENGCAMELEIPRAIDMGKKSLARELLMVDVQLGGMWRSVNTADIYKYLQPASLVHRFEASTQQQEC